jgi:alpha-1,6-mannosyltransferase
VRIVQLANFHTPTSGGLRVAVDTLRAGYLGAGHSCTLVAPGTEDAVAGSVHTLRSPKLPNRTGYRVILRRRAVLGLLDELRPDVVEIHDKLLQQWIWAWSRVGRIPVVAVSHERLAASVPMLLPFAPPGVVRSATRAVARRVLERCDALVTCSRYAAAEFAPDAHLHVVPLGVDLAVFRPGPSTAHATLRLVAASRLSAEKRPDIAIECLRSLVDRGRDVRLAIIGAGPMATELAELAAGLPVHFAGFEPDRANLGRWLAAADVALVPGPAETFGLAGLEALACGTPIVVVDGSAPAEFVAAVPNAGRAAQPRGATFASAVESLLEITPADRRAAARQCAEAYPWSATVMSMLDIHAQLVAGSRAANPSDIGHPGPSAIGS